MFKKSNIVIFSIFVTLIILLVPTAFSFAGVCGDVNADSTVNVGDAVYLISYIFKGGPEPTCDVDYSGICGDINGDAGVNVADAVYLINYVFKGGPEPLCYSIPTTTTIIPEEDTTVVQDYDTLSGAITLDESSSYAQSLSVGDILIGQDDDVTPNGFLRKVTSVTVQGSSIVVETEQATMMEAFDAMDIDEEHQLLPSDVVSYRLHEGAQYTPDKNSEIFNVDLNVVLYDNDGDPETTNDQIRLDGNYAFSAKLFAKIKMKWFSLKKFETGIITNQNANLDLIATMQWQFSEEVEFDLAEFHLAAIPVGGVIWLVPTLTVEAHIKGDLTVTVETSVTYTQELRYGFGWADDQFYTISEGTKDFTYSPPEFTAEFNFEPGTSLNASCLLYGVAGPYMAGKTGLHFQSVLSIDPCDVELTFDLEAILYAVAGIECDILGLDYNHQWELYRHLIGEWIYPLGGSGTVVVDPEPDALNAPWSLTGPCSYNQSGNGDNTLTSLDPGDYTITWGEVSGWLTPSNSTQSVTADETITFTATYTEAPPSGTIVIDPSPDALNAPWSLAGPNSYAASGNGDMTLPDLEPGEYTVTWGTVAGWITPPNSTQTLPEDGTITFSGTYVEEPTTGTIVIDPSPDALNAPWSLDGPEGYNTSGTGDETLTELAVGDYTITWGAVNGWITPSNSTQTLVADETVTFSGTYTEETGTVTDIDGNVYQTIQIGDQEWMMENLKVTHYRNGDPIPHVTDGSTWGGLTTGAYCEYDNNSVNVATYGRLYNWYAVDDSRNIAPAGWHVPTDEEWKQLEMYLGMSQAEADATGYRGTDEGGKLKETGTTHWSSPNEGATNESGFTALPGGYRYGNGYFYDMGIYAIFWSSTETSSFHAWFRLLYYYNSQVGRGYDYRHYGFSVRCVRD